MSRRMILLLAVVLTLAGGANVAQAQGELESPDIFRLEISECKHDPAGVRYQTGFRVAGTAGVVTALHGVADDCKQINAVGGGDDGPVFEGLSVSKVDVDADIALLSSQELAAAERKPQLKAMSPGTTLKSSDSLRVIGYPYGMYAQLASTSLRVRDSAMVPLSRLIPPNLISPIRARNSPSTSISVVSVEGHFLAGQSGAPVFNKKGEVVGVVNGGLQEGHAEVSWMMDWNDVILEAVDQQEVKERLEQLKTSDPLLVFSASSDDNMFAGPTLTAKPTAAVYKYGVVVRDESTGSYIGHAIASLYIGEKLAATCYTDSDGFCILLVVPSDDPARLLVERTGYTPRERVIADLLPQASAQVISLSAAPTATQVPTPTSTQVPTPTPTSTPAESASTPTDVPSDTPAVRATAAPAVPTNTRGTVILDLCPVRGVFADTWRTYKDRLGCDLGDAITTDVTYQQFENGLMAWIKETDKIYVLPNQGAWTQHDNLWSPQDPLISCAEAQAQGKPQMGFGKLWCESGSIKSGLGSATSAELPSRYLPFQYFEGGKIFEISEHYTIVLLDDSSWYGH